MQTTTSGGDPILARSRLKGSTKPAALQLLAAMGLQIFVTFFAQVALAADNDRAIFGKYTYWMEMTSVVEEEAAEASQGSSVAPLRGQPRKIFIPAFMIDNGKFAIRLQCWEGFRGNGTSSVPPKLYSDRLLTVEHEGVDLVEGFKITDLNGAVREADHFHHAVYAQTPPRGFIKVEFEVTRQPNRFETPMAADRTFFDPQAVDCFVPHNDDSKGPLSVATGLGKRAFGFALDLVLAVERIFAKSKTAITPNYLARISQSSSKFHNDYLEYKREGITEDELIGRLPHVGLIGDSLSKNAYVASLLSNLWRVRTEHQRNWFLDTDKAPDSIYSVYERLEDLAPLVAVEYTGVGARVDSGRDEESIFQVLSKTRNFSQQVSQVLNEKRFPDLLLIWIGHNNINWARSLDEAARKSPEKYLQRMMWRFRKDYADQLLRLVDQAKKEKYKTVIVVYGMVNFEAFFKARQSAEALKAKNPELYPYLETDYQYFVSMRPEYRNNMVRLAVIMNAELRRVVDDMNQGLRDYPNVRLEYSDALATADLSPVELIHAVDAWHPSSKGHNDLAQAAFGALSGGLRFLGLQPE